MPDHDFEPRFERRLREYAEEGVRPFDAVEISRAARTRAGAPGAGRSTNPFATVGRLVLVTALLVAGLIAIGFAAGLLPPDTAIVPTPTRTATAEVTPSLPPTMPPTASPSAAPTVTAGPTASPSPSPVPSPSPAPPTPTATPPPLGGWLELTDFPFGDATHLTDITAGGPGYVAVGWASDGAGGTIGGRAWTSPDGVAWTPVTSEAFAGARLKRVVTVGGGLFVIGNIPNDDPDVPWLGRDHVWRSTDGSAWELLPQPAQFADASVEDVVVLGDELVAGGYRDSAGPTSAVIWLSNDGIAWREAAAPPGLYSILRLASDREGTIIALGNNPASPPSRTLWYSTDGGERWNAADAPMLADAEIDLLDVAGQPGGFVAVGKRGDLNQTRGFSIVSDDGATWMLTPGLDDQAAGLPMQVIERVVSIRGAFLGLGTRVEVQTTPCAPANCVEAVPVEARAWTSARRGRWQPAIAPGVLVDMYSAVAVGASGALVAAYTFEGSVWFVPFAE